jgi:hypothetical protein
VDYAHISYERLVGMRRLLENLIRRGDTSSDVLLQVDTIKTEMETRRFRLIGRYAGGTIREYGRWQTREQCEQHAEILGLPVGKYEVGGKPFEMVVMEVP